MGSVDPTRAAGDRKSGGPSPAGGNPKNRLRDLFLTEDCAIHAGTAAALVALLTLGGRIGTAGTVAVAVAVSLIFFVREMEQAAPDGERWKPGRWSAHRHAEWLVAIPTAFLAAAAEILFWHLRG